MDEMHKPRPYDTPNMKQAPPEDALNATFSEVESNLNFLSDLIYSKCDARLYEKCLDLIKELQSVREDIEKQRQNSIRPTLSEASDLEKRLDRIERIVADQFADRSAFEAGRKATKPDPNG